MISKHSFAKYAAAVAGASALILAFAGSASAATTAPKQTPASLSTLISQNDSLITKRIANLTAADTKIAGMDGIQSSVVSTIAATTQTEIQSLTALKAKIDADTTMAAVRKDQKSISSFSPTVPQERSLAMSDRVSKIIANITALQAKLQTRITEAQSKGTDVTALQAAYADITAKLADASIQSQSVQTALITPVTTTTTTKSSAKGEKKAVTLASRDGIQAANADLKAARTDIQTIIDGLNVNKTTS